MHIEEQHTFTPGGSTSKCSDIVIKTDDIVEGGETFSAGISSEEDILEQPISAFILIDDSSSKSIPVIILGFPIIRYTLLIICV